MTQHKNREKTAAAFDPPTTLDLRTFEKFKAHPLVAALMQRYQKDAIFARYAVRTLLEDLKELNNDYSQKHIRTAFTTIEGRVKTEQSFLLKVYKLCRESSASRGITQKSLKTKDDLVQQVLTLVIERYFDSSQLLALFTAIQQHRNCRMVLDVLASSI